MEDEERGSRAATAPCMESEWPDRAVAAVAGCFGRDSDRCWDLLRRRRAFRGAGGDPDSAEVHDAGTVEGYLQ